MRIPNHKRSRRGFLEQAAKVAAAAAFAGGRVNAAQEAAGPAGKPLRIVSVKAYPVRVIPNDERSETPKFKSDFDPARWRHRGPFAQLNSAIIVVIKTDQGVTGYGLGAGGSVAAEIIHGHLSHLLVGADARNVELLWNQMYTSSNAYGRRGVFVMALSGVDNALWDILGKSMGQPVHRLLGGTTKERAPVYMTNANVEVGLKHGVRWFKLPIGDGVFEGREGMKRIVERLKAARQAIGPDAELMIDCSSRWDDVEYTLEMARRLEEVRLYFLEEPLSPDDIFGYARLVREVKSTRIAHGEHEYTHYGFEMLFHHNAIEVVQPDVSWCGGLTSLKRIAVMSGERGLPFIPHRGGSLFGLPLVLTTPHCPVAESFGTGQSGTDVFHAMTPRFEGGYYFPPEKPGFGTELNEELVKKHLV
jgi:L-alanine-DL-glutamate epimerase-like enolase superfamily enzyme